MLLKAVETRLMAAIDKQELCVIPGTDVHMYITHREYMEGNVFRFPAGYTVSDGRGSGMKKYFLSG